jgi:hypothetical protein
MPTSVNVKEPTSPQNRARGLAEVGERVAIGALIAVGFVCLVVSAINYRLVGTVELEKDVGQYFVGP